MHYLIGITVCHKYFGGYIYHNKLFYSHNIWTDLNVCDILEPYRLLYEKYFKVVSDNNFNQYTNLTTISYSFRFGTKYTLYLFYEDFNSYSYLENKKFYIEVL